MSTKFKTARELFPEYNLVPSTYYNVPIFRFQNRFDYVQDLSRNNGADSFHILCKACKSGAYKFGVLCWKNGLLFNICQIAIPAIYDKIDFLGDTTSTHIIAIVQRAGKFGLHIWEHKWTSFNYEQIVPTEYDSLIFEPDKRQFRAMRGGDVCFYDMTGHILK